MIGSFSLDEFDPVPDEIEACPDCGRPICPACDAGEVVSHLLPEDGDIHGCENGCGYRGLLVSAGSLN